MIFEILRNYRHQYPQDMVRILSVVFSKKSNLEYIQQKSGGGGAVDGFPGIKQLLFRSQE
jgi:hypothetical protein